MLARLARRLFGLTRLERAFDDADSGRCGGSIFARLVEVLDLRLAVSERDARRIPVHGPLVVVANHPTGATEGIALTALLDRVRDDVKVLGHPWFASYPALAERMYLVDPSATAAGRRQSAVSMRAAAEWVAAGGALIVFPAGAVARFRWSSFRITDARWRSGLVRLLERSPARVLPVHMGGSNGPAFQLLSLIHPRLGALLLAREVWAKRGGQLKARIGRPLRSSGLAWCEGRHAVLAHLRKVVFALAERSSAPASAQDRRPARSNHITG